MKLIVGLGNPGKEYDGTRHNIGFELIDLLARANGGIAVSQKRARALVGSGTIAEQRVLLVKPQTFMNLSGESVAAIAKQDEIPLTDILVLVDEIHLPVGRLRLRGQGSSGGHNGLKSIANMLASQEFARLRLGVGEPPPGLQIDWVLSRYSRADRVLVDDMLITAMGAVEVWARDGIETAMNRFNAL